MDAEIVFRRQINLSCSSRSSPKSREKFGFLEGSKTSPFLFWIANLMTRNTPTHVEGVRTREWTTWKLRTPSPIAQAHSFNSTFLFPPTSTRPSHDEKTNLNTHIYTQQKEHIAQHESRSRLRSPHHRLLARGKTVPSRYGNRKSPARAMNLP